jgi:TonB-dependent SusC/RagA subfamily outer membrane receptor
MLRLLPAILSLLFSMHCFSQLKYPAELQELKQASHYKAIYRVPADSMYRWVRVPQINIGYLNTLEPVCILPDSVSLDSAYLPAGQYVWVNSYLEWARAHWYEVTETGISFAMAPKQNRLLVYAGNEQPTIDASVKFKGKWLAKNKAWNGFEVPAKKWEAEWILVITPSDTLITQIEQENNYGYDHKYKKQMRNWPIIGPIIRFPKTIPGWFDGEPSYKRKRKLEKKYGTEGFVLFNQPLYKPGDTVKLKAWLTDGRENPLKEPQKMTISYMKSGKWMQADFGKINPVSPGSYLYTLPLPDSFPSDTRYTVNFSGKHEYASFSSAFSIEDYKLPDISKFTWKTNGAEFLKKDTLVLTAEATDASGLPLLDASLEVLLLTNRVLDWEADTLFVPDTLYRNTLKINTNGPTTLSIALGAFPKADLNLTALAILRNSSNETEERDETFNLYQHKKEIGFLRAGDSLTISWNEDDIPVMAKAILTLENDYWEKDTLVQLPCTIPWHPLAEFYSVSVLDNQGRIVDEADYEAEDDQQNGLMPNAAPDFKEDSVGFRVANPGKMRIYFSVYTGKQKLWEGTTNNQTFSWYTRASEKKMYWMRYDWVHNGESQSQTLRMGLPYKWLQVQTETSPMVQPGTRDTLQVKVTDYRGRPAENINLSAVAHNLQLSDRLNLPSLPLVHTYKNKKTPKAPFPVEEQDPSLKTLDVLFPFKNIRQALGTDTMPWYKWLYAKEAITIHRSIIKSPISEVAVHAQRGGVPEKLYTVYINNLPIWSHLVNTKYFYSHQVMPGYAKVSIRTRNALFNADSVYIQPYYKHDIFFNLDSLFNNKNISVEGMPDTLKPLEKEQLSRYFVKFEYHTDNYGALLWQGSRVHWLNTNQPEWVAGPFEPFLLINAWKDNWYQTAFPMEGDYRYRIGNDLIRMEKMPLINLNPKILKEHGKWRIGEEIPVMQLPPKTKPVITKKPILSDDQNNYATTKSFTTSQVNIITDSLNFWQVWIPATHPKAYRVSAGSSTVQHQLELTTYRILLVKEDGRTADLGSYMMRPYGMNCFRWKNPVFEKPTTLTDSILVWQKERNIPISPQKEVKTSAAETIFVRKGESVLSGYVKDIESGLPVPGASVTIKGTQTGTSTDANGYYRISGIGSGEYTLAVASVGYEWAEKNIRVKNDQVLVTDFSLKISQNSLDEVVVVGYGTVSKRSMTGSVVKVESSSFDNMLEGKVAGVQVSGNAGADAVIRIRGTGSFQPGNQPFYVVDGVVMEGFPEGLDTTMGNISIEVLKQAAAVGIYGSRAANGVILINTGRNAGPSLRTSFSDYAYWQPNLFTGKDGTARIPVQYPDNITNWQHAVYAAGPKGRYGRNLSTTKAFKAVQGQLSTPSFLIEGDSTYLVGKAMNYTDNSIRLEAAFTLNGLPKSQTVEVGSMDAVTPEFGLKAPASPDTIKPTFTVKDAKGRSDGEQRTIPVLPLGTIETAGSFYALFAKDTTIRFTPERSDVAVQVFATTKLLDLVDRELESLAAYPYDCLEQTANKLWGLLMIKDIRKAKNQPFKYEKRIAPLLNKLLKNQNPDGGWGWWPGGSTNLYITTCVLQVLRHVPATDATRKALREGYLHLQNSLPTLGRSQKIETLYALSQGGHVYPYKMALDSIPFDSISLHQQWQYFSTISGHIPTTDILWQKLWKVRTESATGALYWGRESWNWFETPKATMVVAWRAIKADSSKEHLLPKLQQYFLEYQQNGWGNTVEKAEICNLLLQEAIRQKDFTAGETKLKVNGETTIANFPAKFNLPQGQTISMQKTGFGLMYLTLYQQWQNKTPQKVDSLFDITTTLVQRGDTVKALKAGSSAMLKVRIDALKSAQFVMVEIPIPAGCVVTQKEQVPDQHREYLKDRTVVFIENLKRGLHYINIPLDVRYKGNYTLNPAKIELMYQPVFYGREEMKQVGIQ